MGVTDAEGVRRMADVIWIDSGARNPKFPKLFQVGYVENRVITWVNNHLINLSR